MCCKFLYCQNSIASHQSNFKSKKKEGKFWFKIRQFLQIDTELTIQFWIINTQIRPPVLHFQQTAIASYFFVQWMKALYGVELRKCIEYS